jgi:hypothetical protein
MTTKPSTASRVGYFLSHWLMTVQGGWLFMLAVGIVHHEWIPACPTIGFWWSLLLVILLKWTFAGGSTVSDMTNRTKA